MREHARSGRGTCETYIFKRCKSRDNGGNVPLAANATLNHELSVVLLETVTVPEKKANYKYIIPAKECMQKQYKVLSVSSSSNRLLTSSFADFLPETGGGKAATSLPARRRRSVKADGTGGKGSSDLTRFDESDEGAATES